MLSNSSHSCVVHSIVVLLIFLFGGHPEVPIVHALSSRSLPLENNKYIQRWMPPPSTLPFGIRTAFGSEQGSVTVTWSTTAPLSSPPCVKSIESKQLYWCNTIGGTRAFIEPSGQGQPIQYIHTVTVSGLLALAQAGVVARVGSDTDGWSNQTVYLRIPSSSSSSSSVPSAPVRLLVFGDLGVGSHALSLPALLNDTLSIDTIHTTTTSNNNSSSSSPNESRNVDAILHVGDLAYDLSHLQGRRAQEFLKMIQPLASTVPYMVAPGNHEAAFNFSHYKSLFTMPNWNASENMYYSFDIGDLVHVVVYNTEVFFWPQYFDVENNMKGMYDWLAADLKKYSATNKWILVAGHRPMYCAKPSSHSAWSRAAAVSRCGWEAEASRQGIPSECLRNNPRNCRSHQLHHKKKMLNTIDSMAMSHFPIEDLLHKYKVDVAVYGHIHDYERYHAVYNYTVVQPSIKDSDLITVYKDPNATVHVVSGAGGNPEMRIGGLPPPQGPCAPQAYWCAFQSGFAPTQGQGYDFSHSRVTAHNATHLQWVQYSSVFKTVIDEFWIIKSLKE